MFNFFAKENDRKGDLFYITDTDYNHIKNVLRMAIGEQLLVSENSQSHLCVIEDITEDCVIVRVKEENYNDTSLPIEIYLFQALAKSEKTEFIIQKAVELGACGIYPTETENCVVKLDDKKKKSKLARWQTIAEAAAKQSKRNIIPEVFEVISFQKALEKMKEFDLFIFPFENAKGMVATKEALKKLKKGMKVAVMIGPEGGFSLKEAEKAKSVGAEIISLGKRILRTETAAVTALSMLMLYSETELSDD